MKRAIHIRSVPSSPSAQIPLILLVALLMMPLVPIGEVDSFSVQARSSKRSSNSSKSLRKAKPKSSTRKVASSKTRSSRRSGRTKSGLDKAHRRGKKSHAHHTVHKPPPPTPEQIEANRRRESSYQTMARAYHLYDEGANARISGNYPLAIERLTESWKLFNDIKSYQRTGESSLAEALVHYELAQAAEASGDILTARDSYVRCLNIRPTLVEGWIRLVNMLAGSGQWQMALAKAQDSVRANPDDARAHFLFALALSKTGHADMAATENKTAKELLKAVPHYKPAGIDAVYKRSHPGEEETDSAETGSGSTGKSDVDNPEDVMGDTTEAEDEEE